MGEPFLFYYLEKSLLDPFILNPYYIWNIWLSQLYTNSGTHLYPESTALIKEIEATGVQLKPEAYL